MRGPSALRIIALAALLWPLASGAAWAVFNGIPPVNAINPDDVQGVTVKLPDQPPQQAVNRETCEKTRKPGETCPLGYDWYVDLTHPLKQGGIIDVTYLGTGKKVIADGQVSVSPRGGFGDWLKLEIGYRNPALNGQVDQGFSLTDYTYRLATGFQNDANRAYFNRLAIKEIFDRLTPTPLEAIRDTDLMRSLDSFNTGLGNYRVPLIRARQHCVHGTGNAAQLIQRIGLVPVSGYTIPADDGGGFVISGYVFPENPAYRFIDYNTIQVDEPRTAIGGGPRTGTGTGGGTGTRPGTSPDMPKDGPTGGDDGGTGDHFDWARADWTEEVICREELQNNGGAAVEVNVRPKAPDAKDFVDGKNTPQWDPAKDGKGPAVANGNDPEKVKKLVEEAVKEAGGQPVEIEISDDDCLRTRTLLQTVGQSRADVAAITEKTGDCPYPKGRLSVSMVDEEVYSVFTFGTTDTYKDLADIVSQLQAKVAPRYDPTGQCGKCIEQLDIWGHGDTGGGYISFGPNDAVIGKQNMGAVDEGLAGLAALMCKGGKVVVNQCKGGTGNKGTEALQQMADKIGVPVSGPEGEIKACRVFGGAITSYKTANPGPDAKTPDQNKPADMKAPSTASK